MLARFENTFDALLRLQRDLEGRFASNWLGQSTASMGAFPPINVFRQGDNLVAVVELPGVTKDDLDIQAKDNTIRISGTKSVEYDQQGSVHRRERIAGSFDRTITLPVRPNPDGIKAEFRNGLLALFIPRAESDKPRSVQIG